MTVSTKVNKVSFAGDNSTVAFPLGSGFIFFDSSELRVLLVTNATGAITVQTETTHYTVSGGSGASGTVTMVTAPTTAQTLVIRRVMPLTHATDLVNNTAQDAEVLEDALDRVVLAQAQFDEAISRALRLPENELTDGVLPAAATRAGKLLRFTNDASALPELVAAIDVSLTTLNAALTAVHALTPAADRVPYYTGINTAALATFTAFARTLLDDADAGTARATLAAFEDVFTTRGDLLRAGASGAEERFALGSVGQVLASDGTDAVWAGRLETESAQTPSGVTSVDFTGLRAGLNRIVVLFSGVSTNGTAQVGVQLGDTEGFETSGYTGLAASQDDVVAAFSSRFLAERASAASSVFSGLMLLQRVTGNVWVELGGIGFSDGLSLHLGAGVKTLSAELDRVRITMDGVDTFDAGTVNISYE